MFEINNWSGHDAYIEGKVQVIIKATNNNITFESIPADIFIKELTKNLEDILSKDELIDYANKLLDKYGIKE